MPTIRPISDLRNNFNLISEIAHHDGEPVFITKNGQSDLVVMSHAAYEQQQALIELYQKLAIAEKQSNDGIERKSHAEVMKNLRSLISGQNV
ncbi:type II toxin-antitoxin system Phd/YefM family antitoxin [Paenibacillus sp. F411]|uniref:Antitoxin n=1 Tax=Paenibacillus algicola TaxID=2565926 RepID=A0A4P8XM84_9BACL|nr:MULTISPECIES: type II toxin-antitoxin system prevent-host-death family antitoxin [Paenibacillus]MBO2942634.1 type II toxin-antitoxin system Phd/YefM family antitoxin [Paenibacillus sp. F411]QCT03425.1 prevent-host-death family protein [Paenibacillus algicola]